MFLRQRIDALKILNHSRLYILLNVISGILSSMLKIYVIIFPKDIVNCVLDHNFEHAYRITILYIVCGLITASVKNLVDYLITNQKEYTKKRYDEKLKVKFMELEYQKIETAEYLDKKEKARVGKDNIIEFGENINIFITCVLTIGYVCYLLFQLSLILVAIVIATVLFSSYLNYRKIRVEERLQENFVVLNRKWDYLNYICRDKDNSKEIRLYNLGTWLSDKIRYFVENNEKLIKENYHATTKANVGDAFGQNIQSVIVYLYLGYKVIKKVLSIGEFLQYVTAVSTLSGSLTSIAKSFQNGLKNLSFMANYKSFVELESFDMGELDLPNDLETFDLVIENLSFKYPDTEKYVLKNFSLHIHPGEKVSIVGLNGAGKTTLIKLILRLYTYEEGRILLNGVDIRKYKLEDYRRKFSAVFQDFKIFSFTVEDNILMGDMGEIDHEKVSEEKERRVWNAIESAEFTDKINQLKNGLNTFMMCDYEKDGIELSGGMQQKIALCRAYYREPKMLILDEPTSMLDPMEEYKMYQGLSKLSDDKTAIFISHRLASSKFCDKIAYLENGRVIEYGTHEELMQENGKYYALFMKQAQYYDKID